ncbi:MAG: hypothetical protein ACRDOE_07200, partial [Streptosporangiaceae bacterium]
MATATTNGEAIGRFCALLDKNSAAGAVMRRWMHGGCKLPVVFFLASVPFGGVGKEAHERWMGDWRRRGARVLKGMTKAIDGLEEIQRAAPESFSAQAAASLARLREQRDAVKPLCGVQRFGVARHHAPLAVLREYVGRRTRWSLTDSNLAVAENGPVGTAELLQVVRV